MKSTLPALIGKRIVSAFIALLMLLSAIAVAVVSGVGASTQAIAAPNDGWTVVEDSTEVIPLEPVKFPLNLGKFKQDEGLDVKSIELDSKTKRPVITWVYTANVTNELTAQNQKLERFFTTSAESGLGQPTIVSVTKNGAKDNGTITTSANGKLLYSAKDTRTDKTQLATGTYVYTIKTPILEPRKHYVLNVANRMTTKLIQGTTVTVDGNTRTLDKDEVVTGYSFLNFSLEAGRNPVLSGYVNPTPQRTDVAAGGVNVAGYYTSPDQIHWEYSYINTTNSTQDHNIAINLDESHRRNGSAKVYVYQPGVSGYELVKTRDVPADTSTVPVTLKPGWRVQLVTTSTVTDNKVPHTFSGATVSALKADMTVKKFWHKEVLDAEKVETTYSVEDANGKTWDLTIPKGGNSAVLPGMDSYDTNFQKIRYFVSENPVPGMILYNQLTDSETYTYSFFNRKRAADDAVTPISGSCSTKVYGVFELETTDINQYWLTAQRYATGSGLKGKFRVPANATGGDHFILKLPPELKLEYSGDGTYPLGQINGKPGWGGLIGQMYYIGGNQVKFVLWDNATHDQDYEGWFTIGRELPHERIQTVNGSGRPKQGEKYYWGLRENPDLVYNPADPKANVVVKNLEYQGTYIGLNGSAEPCKYSLSKWTTFHYQDNGINQLAGQINKYVTKETDDALHYRSVFNARGIATYDPRYEDNLSETIQLYHGNSDASLRQDVKVYTGVGLLNGGVRNDSLVELWPNRSPLAPAGLEVKKVYTKPHNQYIPAARPGHKDVRLNYKVIVEMSGHRDQTMVLDVKAKKLQPHTEGFYHNQAYVAGRGLNLDTNQSSYQPTQGVGAANYGKLVDISFMKVDEAGHPIRNNPASFRLYHDTGVYSTKVQADENGVITFRDVIPEGVHASGPFDGSNGIYNLIEAVPPQGYVKGTSMRIKVTTKIVDGKKVPHIEVLKYIEQKVQGTQIVTKEWDVEPELRGKTFPASLKLNGQQGLFQFKNQKIPSVAIKKIDSISKAPLRGAVFKLNEYPLADFNLANPVAPKRSILLGCEDSTGELADCVTVNADEFRVPSAKVDHIYEFQEVKAPSGYDLHPHKFYIKLVKEKTGSYSYEEVNPDNVAQGTKLDLEGDVFTYQLENKRSNKIAFTKADVSGQVITEAKAQFRLYKLVTPGTQGGKDIALASGQQVHVLPAPDGVRKIDASPSFNYQNLADGTYYLIEEVAPAGYILPKYPVATFKVSGQTVISDAADNKLQITNHPRGKFKLLKTNDAANPQPLPGAGFTLYRDANFSDVVVEQQITGKTGVLYFENLDQGTYWLKETKVPHGYVASAPLKIVVTAEGKTLVEQGQTGAASASTSVIFPGGGTGRAANASNTQILDVNGSFGELQRQDPKHPNGVHQATGVEVSQKISATSELGKYRVDVSISGAGLKNSAPKTDVLVMLERRNNSYMYGGDSGDFYRDRIINDVITPLKSLLPEGSRISIWKWATNSTQGEVIDFTPLGQAAQALRDNYSKLRTGEGWDTRHFGYERDQKKDFPALVDNGMSDADRDARKVVLTLAGLGLNDSKIKDWNRNEKINFTDNRQRLTDMLGKYDFYLFNEAVYKDLSDANKFSDLGSEFVELGLDQSHVGTVANSLPQVQSRYLDGFYVNVLSNLVNQIGAREGSLGINLSDNVTLDEKETLTPGSSNISFQTMGDAPVLGGQQPATLVWDAQSKAIHGSNLRFSGDAVNPALNFSYHVRSNVAAAKLDTFEPINAAANYQPDLSSATSFDLPIPQVKVPGATYTLARSWEPGVPQNLQGTSSSISLLVAPEGQAGAPAKLVERKTLAGENNLTFKPVPVFNSNGQTLVYQASESGLTDKLTSEIRYNNNASYTGVKRGNATITVVTGVKKTNFLVRKIWENTPVGKRKDVQVMLKARAGGAELALSSLGVENTLATLNASNNFETKFTGLPYYGPSGDRIVYSVEETALAGAPVDPKDYRTEYDYGSNYATVTNIKTDEVTVVNKRQPYLRILKRDANTSNTEPLNARFKLEKLTADGKVDTKFYDQGWAAFWTADPNRHNDGILLDRDITEGKYRLTEEKAPAGYEKLADPIEFELPKTLSSEIKIGESAKLKYNADTHTFELTVLNRQTVEIPGSFPLTGGSGFGTHLFITGIFLAASVLWLRHTVQGQVG
ncbi:SpaA isopeptide-forming pilin-related protein [Arcanobacterium hippocoleae]|uniref:LPXTG cell wall anchor domain-containing protein n=1 Tax=Arcanobacterium hippocoleae TaxID=149017 RepID=A0ABU1T1X4_9ACTO|nr:SpaA isopeptide-forming pilin-related protein [Arcanobacterium hippocoleae]MDR6939369.1 hypothetical protein [Arcanobacterium hippocoleae]